MLTAENEDGAEPAGARAPRALIVDDSRSVRSVLRGMLEGDGMEVVEAASGHEALQLLSATSDIGLVFVDLNMPDMDGLQMIARFEAEHPARRVPMVVLTGSSPPATLDDVRSQGAAGWLQKPVRLEALVRVARRFLGPS